MTPRSSARSSSAPAPSRWADPSFTAPTVTWGKAGVSLALRAGLSLIGGAIGAGIGADSCSQYVYDHEGCAIGYGVLGLIAGATTAVIVDAAVLAREIVPAPARDHVMFVFTPVRSGGGLTLVGRF